MKVKELRNWLSDLGEKNKQHFLQGSKRREDKENKRKNGALSAKDAQVEQRMIQKSSTMETSPSSSRGDVSPSSQMDRLEMVFFPTGDGTIQDCESGRLSTSSLTLLPKDLSQPAISSSFGAPSSDNLTKELRNVPKYQALNSTSWEIESFPESSFSPFPKGSFDDLDACSMEENGRFSDPVPSVAVCNPDYIRRNTIGGIQGLDDMGREHMSLIEKHGSRGFVDISHDGSHRPDLEPASSLQLEAHLSEEANATTMHDAKIFGNQTLTATTLDLICQETKTVDFLSQKSREQAEEEARDDQDTDDLQSYLSSHSWTSKEPSIAPDAMDYQMSRLFLNETTSRDGSSVDTKSEEGSYKKENVANTPPKKAPRRKKIDAKTLAFLQPKSSAKDAYESCIRKHPTQVPLGPRSAVRDGIYKFGGPRKRIVEKRKEELEKIWADNREAVFVKNVKWGDSKRHGTYKKKIVLDVQR